MFVPKAFFKAFQACLQGFTSEQSVIYAKIGGDASLPIFSVL